MRNGLTASVVVLLMGFAASSLHAQTSSGAAQTIPDLSGIWEAPYERVDRAPDDICGEGACNAVLELKPFDLLITVDEPQMQTWAEEYYKASREGDSKDPNAFPREDADPWFSACTPFSPAALLLSPIIAIELRQFPDAVLLLFGGTAGDADHDVRRVYVDGRSHPPNLQPTWMGHSIGRYDGDTLIVDTIGIHSINGNRWLDFQGHPHTDALHLVERIRRLDQNSLEFEVTINDPEAYTNSWAKKVVRKLAAPGPRVWEEVNCEELLQMGTHFGAEVGR